MADRLISGHAVAIRADNLLIDLVNGTTIPIGDNVGGTTNVLSKFYQQFAASSSVNYNGSNGLSNVMFTEFNQQTTATFEQSTLFTGVGSHLLTITPTIPPEFRPQSIQYGPCTIVDNGVLVDGLYRIELSGIISIGLIDKSGTPSAMTGGEVGFLSFSATYRSF